jgi:hypothetical protein
VVCPFCNSLIDGLTLVCPACRRDVAVPTALLKERDELVNRRGRLISDLAEAKARLASRRLSESRSQD